MLPQILGVILLTASTINACIWIFVSIDEANPSLSSGHLWDDDAGSTHVLECDPAMAGGGPPTSTDWNDANWSWTWPCTWTNPTSGWLDANQGANWLLLTNLNSADTRLSYTLGINGIGVKNDAWISYDSTAIAGTHYWSDVDQCSGANGEKNSTMDNA